MRLLPRIEPRLTTHRTDRVRARRLSNAPLTVESLEHREVLSFLSPIVSGDANLSLAGDFTSDGRGDVVTSDYATNTVGLRVGNGDGTFQPAQVVAGGLTPVAAADLNRDGKLDLLAKHASELTVLLGRGDGTFQPPRHTAVPKVDGRTQTVDAIAGGDINRDGKLDLAVTSGGPWSGTFSFWRRTNLHTFLGNGDGTFRLKTTTMLDSNGQGSVPVLGDYNADGKLDVLTSEYDSGGTEWYWRLGKGDGTLGARKNLGAFSGRITAVVAADVNGDGKSDLVAAHPTGNEVRVFLSGGAGGLNVPSHLAVGNSPADLAVADVDRDGRLDVITSNNRSGTVSVLRGHGDGRFQAARDFAAASRPSAFRVADIDGDAWLDLAVGAADGLAVLMNDGQW